MELKSQEVMLRSDHLEAVINYCIEQTKNGGGNINPLDWGDNENGIGYEGDLDAKYNEILAALEGMLQTVKFAIGMQHKSLILLPLPDYYKPVVAYDEVELYNSRQDFK